MIRQLKFIVCQHPPYSPDLAPSDFYLFKFLKKKFRGMRFEDEEELADTVHEWLQSCDRQFFRTAFEQQVSRWKV